MADSASKPNKNTKVGHVVSAKMDKTIVVQVTRRVQHPLYKRVVTRKKKFHAHDEANTARPGDFVRIAECRPVSRTKCWQLEEVLRRAVQVGGHE